LLALLDASSLLPSNLINEIFQFLLGDDVVTILVEVFEEFNELIFWEFFSLANLKQVSLDKSSGLGSAERATVVFTKFFQISSMIFIGAQVFPPP
jgi:hypothetical protein